MNKYLKAVIITAIAATLTKVIFNTLETNDLNGCPTYLFGMTIGETIPKDVRPAEIHDKYLSFAFKPDASVIPKLYLSEFRANATLETRTIYSITAGCNIYSEDSAKAAAKEFMEWLKEKNGCQFVEYGCKNQHMRMWKCPYYSSGIFESKREVGVIAVTVTSDAKYEKYAVAISLFVNKYCKLIDEEAKSYRPKAKIISSKPAPEFNLSEWLEEQK